MTFLAADPRRVECANASHLAGFTSLRLMVFAISGVDALGVPRSAHHRLTAQRQ